MLSSLLKRSQQISISSRFQYARYGCIVVVGLILSLFLVQYASRYRHFVLDTLLRETGITDTQYVPSFSWNDFATVHEGDTAERVIELLGVPFHKYESHEPRLAHNDIIPGYTTEFRMEWDHTISQIVVTPNVAKLPAQLRRLTNESEITAAYGEPISLEAKHPIELWFYTRSPGGTNYWQCIVYFDQSTGKVMRTTSDYYGD